MARLSGKAALVTGAANGIGRAIAERLLDEGARVLALDLEAATVAEAAAEMARGGGEIEPVAGDISRREDVVRAIRRCVERFGGLDVLVANAGIADAQPFLEIEEQSWRRIIDVNLTGTFFCIQEAARVMAPARKGAIVVTSSTNGWYVESNMWHYNASKGGVVALVRSAAMDLGPHACGSRDRTSMCGPRHFVPMTRVRPSTEQSIGTLPNRRNRNVVPSWLRERPSPGQP